MLEEKFTIIELIDTYGMLLTEAMSDILTEYYINDISLAEIAENRNVTRQAIYDSISKAVKKLKSFEDNLKIISKTKCIKNVLDELSTQGKLQKEDYNKIVGILEE